MTFSLFGDGGAFAPANVVRVQGDKCVASLESVDDEYKETSAVRRRGVVSRWQLSHQVYLLREERGA